VSGEAPVVLVVDDHELVLSGLARSFTRAGYRVLTATAIEPALAAAAETPPALAVVDLWLGTGTGIDLIARLRERWPEMGLVLISAAVSISDAVRATRAGADRVLMKPATVAQILGVSSEETAPPTLARVEWEYIMRTLADAKNNISEAARRLGIRRQSLQRKLKRLPPPT
jgi:two-component system response regulator RegA